MVFIFLVICISLSSYEISKREDAEQNIGFILGVIVIALASGPAGWLVYLIGLHTYLIVSKRTTI